MAISLSNLVNNLAERLHEIYRKYKHDHKNMKGVELNIKIVNPVLVDTQVLKMI